MTLYCGNSGNLLSFRDDMSSVPNFSPEHSFADVQLALEETVLRLRNTFDPKSGTELLRHLRVLLEDADRLIATEEPTLAKLLHFESLKEI